MNRSAVVGRFHRFVADTRRRVTRAGSARAATDLFAGVSRSDSAAWISATARQHERYRQSREVPAGRVAAVCVSCRPHLAEQVAENVRRQLDLRDGSLDVVFIANETAADRRWLESRFAGVDSVTVRTTPSDWSLGACLNLALGLTDARFVAKFDDDDLYGPHYLADSLRAHGYAGAGVVGKHSYYARLESTGETLLRFPGSEFRYSSTLAGGTLVIDRDRVGDQEFADRSLGEDRDFIARCHRRGISTFSADRFNFIQVRGQDNTWQPGDQAFRAFTIPVDPQSPEHLVDR